MREGRQGVYMSRLTVREECRALGSPLGRNDITRTLQGPPRAAHKPSPLSIIDSERPRDDRDSMAPGGSLGSSRSDSRSLAAMGL